MADRIRPCYWRKAARTSSITGKAAMTVRGAARKSAAAMPSAPKRIAPQTPPTRKRAISDVRSRSGANRRSGRAEFAAIPINELPELDACVGY